MNSEQIRLRAHDWIVPMKTEGKKNQDKNGPNLHASMIVGFALTQLSSDLLSENLE